MIGWLVAAVRLIHPAPTLAVTVLSGALAAILASQSGVAIESGTVALVTAGVLGSQIFTGATNDLADQARDAALRPDKPLVSGALSPSAALWIASAGLALQVVASVQLGIGPLVIGLVATGSALVYNAWLSRTPWSVVPYLVSFGLLPGWIGLSVGVPLERVAPAMVLGAVFAAAAHLANTLRDFEADAAIGSRCLTQVLGEQRARTVAVALAGGVALAVAAIFLADGSLSPVSAALGVVGLGAIGWGALDAQRLWPGMLVAAVAWTVAWALASA
jgi:4-hydroxybenzoate polyprenyltransferase